MQSTIDEIVRSVQYMIDEALSRTTKSFEGLIKGINSDGTYIVQMNGQTQAVRAYCDYLIDNNSVVKVIVPQGNMNLAYILPMSHIADDFLTVEEGALEYLLKNELAQTVGVALNNAMSQKAFTDAISTKTNIMISETVPQEEVVTGMIWYQNI